MALRSEFRTGFRSKHHPARRCRRATKAHVWPSTYSVQIRKTEQITRVSLTLSNGRPFQKIAHLLVRARDDMRRYHLSDLARGRGAGVDRSLYGPDVSLNHDGNQPTTWLLTRDKFDVGGLRHRIRRLNCCNQADGLDKSERL